MTSERWDHHWLGDCLHHARMSKDPNTKVGAVIIGPDRETRSTGFNGFPRGIADNAERLADRDRKNLLMVHAERNAIYNAARIGTALKGCTLYVACMDDSGWWSGPPCVQCTLALIQTGITEVVGWPFKAGASNWKDNIEQARLLLAEAGIEYREVPRP